MASGDDTKQTPSKGSKVDIESLVKDFFWDNFREKAQDDRKKRNLLKKDYISIDINWDKVRFVHEEPKYSPEVPKPGTGTPSNNVLFSTVFTNKTDKPQTCRFTSSRTTRTTSEYSVESGYTKGMECGLTLKTPGELMEANLGFTREVTLATGENEVNEEEMMWSVDNEIEVKEGCRAEAKLKVSEEEYSGSFTTKTKITGKARATFTNLKDNNSWIHGTEAPIYEIINRAMQQGRVKGSSIVADKSTKTVICTSTGSCKFKYGVKQMVHVEQFELGEDE